MSTFPADIWSSVTRYLLCDDVMHLLWTSRGVRLNVSQGLRKLETDQQTWPTKLLELCPHIDTFISHSTLEDWKCLSQVPRTVKNLSVGYIAGQNAPDFEKCNLRSLSVVAPFISWSIINAFPQSLTELVIQECRFLTDPLFDILPRNLQILSILSSEKVSSFSSPSRYDSTSFITDMALRNLPPSLTDIEIHSTCPFTELGLVLLKKTDLQLRKLKLSPTYFKSASLAYLPWTLIEVEFNCLFQGSELPVASFPSLESLVLASSSNELEVDPFFWSQLPASLTRLTLKGISVGAIGFSFLGLPELASLEIENLGGVHFPMLPRSLTSLHILAVSTQVASDSDVDHLPPSLTKLIYPSDFSSAVILRLPKKLRLYRFDHYGTQYDMSMEIVRESMSRLSAHASFEKLSLVGALDYIKQSLDNISSLVLQQPVVLKLASYSFTEDENASITQLTIPALYLRQFTRTDIHVTFPTNLTRLSIQPLVPLEWDWYTARCIFPDSLTELDAVCLRLFIRRDTSDESANEPLFGGLSFAKNNHHPYLEVSEQLFEMTENLNQLRAASDVKMQYEPLPLPQVLTRLNVGCLMFPECLPSTLTDLSFEVDNNPALLYTLHRLPKSLKKLSLLVEREKLRIPTWKGLLGISREVLPHLENLYNALGTLNLGNVMNSVQNEVSSNPSKIDAQLRSWLRSGFDPVEMLVAVCIWSSSGYSECLSITMMTEVQKPKGITIKDKIMQLASPNLRVEYQNFDTRSWRRLDDKPMPSAYASLPISQQGMKPKKHFHERRSVKMTTSPPSDPPSHPMDSQFTDENFASHLRNSVCSLRLYQNKTLTQSSFEKYLPHTLTVLCVLENQNISDQTVAYLPRSLTDLVLGCKNLSDTCVPLLPRQLKILRLQTDLLTDDCIPELPRSLTSLSLPRECRLSDACVPSLPPALERISLPANNLLTDLAIGRLPQSLLALNLYANTHLTNAGMEKLPPKLEELWLETNRSITDSCFRLLPRTLIILCIGSIEASPYSLADLPSHLHRLHVGSHQLSVSSLTKLSPSLSRLRVGSMVQFSDSIFSSLPLLQWDTLLKRS